MQRRITVTLMAGFVAGVVPFLPFTGYAACLFFSFLPLLLAGLAEGYIAAFQASFLAFVLALNTGGAQSAFNFALFAALPVCVLVSRLMRYREGVGGREWYPALGAVVSLSVMTAWLFLIFAAFAAQAHPGGLKDLLHSTFTIDSNRLDPEAEELMQRLFGEWSYLFFAALGWALVAITWGMGVLANYLLKRRQCALRPDLRLLPYGLPLWLPLVLLISIGFAVLAEANISFAASTLFLLLLFPYFVSGMVILYEMSKAWHPQWFWLTLIYIVLFFMFWTNILVVAVGFYHHLTEILDKREKMR